MITKNISILFITSIVIIFLNQNAFSEDDAKVLDPGKHKINNTAADSIITTLISEINPDSIEYFMQSLEDFGTRYALAPNRFEIANWIKDEFIRFGIFDVVLDSFYSHTSFPLDTTTLQINVVATIRGSDTPDDIYIMGGHYDAITNCFGCDPMINAPGADDNASGTAAVLEIARVIKKMNFQPEATIKFICFASEEIGSAMTGANNYAKKADSLGLNIKVMINHDMIGNNTKAMNISRVNIMGYSEFEEYRDYSVRIAKNYSVLEPLSDLINYAGDAAWFAMLGYPAIWFVEDEFSPHYHDESDLVMYCNMDYCAEVTRASMATIISFIGMPSNVENFSIVDVGDGQSLLLNWSPPADEDLAGYLVYIGTDSSTYDTTLSAIDTSMIINNLTEGVEYYMGITSYDEVGYESFLIKETGTPLSLPLSPSEIKETPLWHQVELKWSPNFEYDLLGYNIYRSTNEEELGGKLNTEVVTDTLFIDASTENGVYYYYTVKAVDSMQNESINNVPLKSRSVSLDQGIVIVDETTDGNGSILNPTDEEVDEFYISLLKRFEKQYFDIIDEGGISLKDLGAFSTVIWDGSDYRDMTTASDIVNDIQRYLDYGGNLIYTGYKPSQAFEGNTIYPTDFEIGDFIFDYLKINHVKSTFGSRFVGAIPFTEGYEEIYTDSLKTSPTSNYHLSYIEGIYANLGGTEIYLYDTDYDTSTNQGKMKNEPVGVEYIGDDYKVVTLSFPLYYMQFDQAKVLMEYILTEKFSEVVSLKDEKQSITPQEFVLEQNYPNPFNPSTKIKFALSKAEVVKIDIYNTLGQGLETLLNEHIKAGQYEVEFNGSHLSSGIYFYRIEAGDFQDVKKMVLIK